jgi:hypothetical protein
MAQVQNGDDAAYVSLARLRIENLERALASESRDVQRRCGPESGAN